MQNQNVAPLTKPSTPWQTVSVRELSISTIRAAILSPSAPDETLQRVNAVLALYFEADADPTVKIAVREEFVRALSSYPAWAMHKAFDAWVKTGHRRPSPGEIAILADREVRPLSDEKTRREELEKQEREEAESRARNRVSDEARARIIAEAGMTEGRLLAVRRFPMARTEEELEEKAAPGKHWSDNLDPDDPQWEALRKARAGA